MTTRVRAPDLTPDPEVLAALRAARKEAEPPPGQQTTAPPNVQDSEGSVGIPITVMVRADITHFAPLLDEQVKLLFNGWAKLYVESRAHAQTALMALEILRSTILLKEGRRLGVPGFAAPRSAPQEPAAPGAP